MLKSVRMQIFFFSNAPHNRQQDKNQPSPHETPTAQSSLEENPGKTGALARHKRTCFLDAGGGRRGAARPEQESAGASRRLGVTADTEEPRSAGLPRARPSRTRARPGALSPSRPRAAQAPPRKGPRRAQSIWALCSPPPYT